MWIIEIMIAVLAAGLIMICHEFPKAILFLLSVKPEEKIRIKKQVFQFRRYIDPVGMLLFLTSFAGFSRPLMYRVREPKMNRNMGLVGMLSIALVYVCSIVQLRTAYGVNGLPLPVGKEYKLPMLFWGYLAMYSAGLFLVNLFPVSTFDMGLLIAGSSMKYYLSMLKSDTVVKCILFASIAMFLLRDLSYHIVDFSLLWLSRFKLYV